MPEQIDIEWMEKVLESQLIIRGCVRRVEDGVITLLHLVSARRYPANSESRLLLTTDYASYWPMRHTISPDLPDFECAGPLEIGAYREKLGEIMARWAQLIHVDREEYLVRKQTVLVGEGPTERFLYPLHLGRLSTGIELARALSHERYLAACLQEVAGRLEAFIFARYNRARTMLSR